MDNEATVVNIGPCRCPGAVHEDGDTATFNEHLSTKGGLAVLTILAQRDAGLIDPVEANVRLWSEIVLRELNSWSILNGDGGPVPITPASLDHHTPFLNGGMILASKAQELYGEVLSGGLPFQKTTRWSSASGRTRGTAKRTARKSTIPTST